MGAWGEGPLENDSAGDFLTPVILKVKRAVLRGDSFSAHKVTPKIGPPVRRGYGGDNYDALRAAGVFLLSLSKGGVSEAIYPEDFDALAKGTKAILADKEYLNGWKSPPAIAKALQAEVRALSAEATRIRVEQRAREARYDRARASQGKGR